MFHALVQWLASLWPTESQDSIERREGIVLLHPPASPPTTPSSPPNGGVLPAPAEQEPCPLREYVKNAPIETGWYQNVQNGKWYHLRPYYIHMSGRQVIWAAEVQGALGNLLGHLYLKILQRRIDTGEWEYRSPQQVLDTHDQSGHKCKRCRRDRPTLFMFPCVPASEKE